MATGFPTVNVTIPSAGLPDCKAGVAYSYFLDALDYTAPLTWAIIAGALPVGLALNVGTGEISGTANTVGVYSVTVRATDSLAKTGDRVLGIRVVPELGQVRRYQTEDSVEGATTITPIEGRNAFATRRILERLLTRTYGAGNQILDPYFLDARDLQVENFDGVPLQSVDDALRLLLAAISSFATGIDDGSGAPYITTDANDNFNIVGIGAITVAKNLGLNRIEISFTGVPLAMPFDLLPAPSGDVTGATDTAALLAFFAADPQRWVVAPADPTNPYYINANITVIAGRRYRVTGKTRDAFAIVGVGGVFTMEGVETLEHCNLTDVRMLGDPVTNYVNVYVTFTQAAALIQTGESARFIRSWFEAGVAGASFADDAAQLDCDGSTFEFGAAGAISMFVSGTGAFRWRVADCIFNNMQNGTHVGFDFTAFLGAADAVIKLFGIEYYGGDVGVPIANRAAVSGIGALFVENGVAIVPTGGGVPVPLL